MAQEQQQQQEAKQYLTLAELASRLQICYRTAFRWLNCGKLLDPVRHPGKKFLFDLAEFERWREAGCPPAEQWTKSELARKAAERKRQNQPR